MISIAISLLATFAVGYFFVGPANQSYSARAFVLVATSLAFIYLFVILMALFAGGLLEGRPVAPVTTMISAVVYSAAVAIATGLGAGLRSRRAS